MNQEDKIVILEKYIRELKQEIKDLRDQLNFQKSKGLQVNPPESNGYYPVNSTDGSRIVNFNETNCSRPDIKANYNTKVIDLHNQQDDFYADEKGY